MSKDPIFINNLRRTAVSICLLFGLLVSLISCSSKEKSSDKADEVFAMAEEYEKNERYDEAIKKYTDVKNRFPYSHYATKAELAIADVHFKDEAFAEAQLSYQTFRELHPKHDKIDYVLFRLGMSYYKQLPDSIDRDLSLANDAISTFDQLIKTYPQSGYVKEAKETLERCEKQLAEKEEYIADFYYKKEQYLSAFQRYDGILRRFAHHLSMKKLLHRASISGHKANRKEGGMEYYKLLREQYPDSKEFDEARRIIE